MGESSQVWRFCALKIDRKGRRCSHQFRLQPRRGWRGCQNKNLACHRIPFCDEDSFPICNPANPLSTPFRLSSLFWIVIPLGAVGFLFWINQARVRQIEYVSSVGELSDVNATDASGPIVPQTRLIVPGHINASYEWLNQTRQMLTQREARVRYVTYENAPFGHEVFAASPYRWWLGLIASIDRSRAPKPIDQAVERAALVADPLLHVLVLVITTLFVAWRFGAFPALLLAVGLTTLFPLAGDFSPGAPEERGLMHALTLWSLLPLMLGVRLALAPAAPQAKSAERCFLVAGIMGGFGLWVSVANQVPLIIGVVAGALVAAWLARGKPAASLPWRTWALGGALGTFAAYLIEFFPGHLGSWEFRAIHPLYGVAWLGGAELVVRLAKWIQTGKFPRKPADIGLMVLAIAAVAALPVGMWLAKNWGFWEADPTASRLTRLTASGIATNFWTWMVRDGITSAVVATFLPLLLVVPAGWLVFRRTGEPGTRISLAVMIGPFVVALGLAWERLSWWNGLDAVLLVVVVVSAAAFRSTGKSPVAQWAYAALAAFVFLPGMIQLIPTPNRGQENALGESEVYGLIERDLARWLAKHVGPHHALILAPHNQTIALNYYGGLPGLATLGWENRDGLAAAMRVVAATTPEEARELVNRRGITHIIIPSWDNYLDVYTQMGMGRIDGTFMNLLHQWVLPSWLRPVPYQLPVIPGFEGQTVTIFEVVEEEQDQAAEMSRIVEYFIEMGQLEIANNAVVALRKFPADLGALVARAQFEGSKNDMAAFTRSVEQLRSRITAKADRNLPWDRRVSLAIVLMRGKQTDLAREQLKRCLSDLDEAKLRSLTTGTLYRLHVMNKAVGLSIDDPKLRDLALNLLPSDLRNRL